MNKRVKECMQLCKRNGLSVQSLSINKHLKIYTKAGIVVFGLSPSDYRWRVKATSTIRKLAKGINAAA